MGTVPSRFRPPLGAQLSALVQGDLPDLLVWVSRYGAAGATLIEQPLEIWTHPLTQFASRQDGSHFAALPLWTTTESPSDLTAEIEISTDGSVTITDVHVM
ncbi:DUF7668 domain-containing protein [Propioniciclava tarda]|uniref:DUF7668 domain-containing protein n=1 Tax=Propioniciclava tarda TaxID=433330 RepID=A0A4Q9KL49_PROTD|nr:hypothetical protein [Propioniciclava tarda]TBT95094.1 hypothetical protein ET996_07480 [Propioniciclava tarda]SMO55864.1 hypothetical protein SAMN06266982_106106 [Propioniciclava tarda]